VCRQEERLFKLVEIYYHCAGTSKYMFQYQ